MLAHPSEAVHDAPVGGEPGLSAFPALGGGAGDVEPPTLACSRPPAPTLTTTLAPRLGPSPAPSPKPRP